MNIIDKKRAIFVIASKDFRDEEYFIPKEILEKVGVEVKTASNKEGQAVGVNGGEANVDFLVENLNISDFDAIIFIGGPGCLKNLDNENSYKLIKETISYNKILASICISPVILAHTGVLKGKKASVWSSAMDKKAIVILKENGAIYEESKVVVDGKIITADGPESVRQFSLKILEMLKNN